MAVTSLTFNIFSTYNGSALARARRDIQSTSNAMSRLDRQSRRTNGGMRGLGVAAVAASPGLLLLAKGAAAATGAFLAMTVSAGTAAGVFGGVMIAAAKRALDLEKAGKKLNSSQKAFVSSTHALTRAWNSFLDRTSGKTLAPLTIVMNGLRRGISRLIPLINAVHPIAMKVARAFARWLVAENGLKRFIGVIVRYGVPSLNHLQMAARHVLAFLGIGFRAFAPLGLQMAKVLERGALALRRWAQGGGFQRFIASVKANGPTISAFFRALGAALRQVSIALGGLGPLMLILATAGLRLIASLPVPVIQALAVAFLLWRVRIQLLIATQVALGIAMAAARSGILGHRAAVIADTIASRLNTAASRGSVLALALQRAASIGAAIGARIHAAATRVAAFATNFLRLSVLRAYIMMGLHRLRLIFTRIATLAWAAATRAGALAMYFLRLRTLQTFIMMGLYRLRVIFTRLATLAWAATTRFMSLVLSILRLRTLGMYIMLGLYRLRIIFTRLATLAWMLVTRAASLVMMILRFRLIGTMVVLGLYRLRLLAARLATLLWAAASRAVALIMGILRLRMIAMGVIMLAYRARLIAAAVATRIFAFAQLFLANVMKIVRIAMILARFAMLALPILAVAALIIFLATRTRFFQTVWRVVWTFVRNFGRAVWAFLRAAWRATVNFFIRVFRVLSVVGRAVWRGMWNIIRAVGLGIWRFMRAAWNALKNFFVRVFRVLSAVGRAVWRGMWNAIRAIGLAIWRAMRAAWNATKNFFIRVGRALFAGLVRVFNALKNWWLKTFWPPVRNFFTKTIPNAFRAAVRFIGRAWNTLKKILSAPVKAVVDVVWNKGLRNLWNTVAGIFGGKKIKPFKFKGFKQGGYTGNMGKNEVAGVVHGQEYVIPYKQLKAMGGPKAIRRMGPQALWALQNGQSLTDMTGLTSKNPGGPKSWTLDPMYKNKMGSVGGLPVGGDGFDPGGIFSGIADFFKEIGGGIKNAFSAVGGFSSKVLGALGSLDSCSAADICSPLIQAAANVGKGVVNGIVPGAPPLQRMFTGEGNAKKIKLGEGVSTGQGAIQMIADTVRNWILEHANCSGCGFTEFRKWKAGDGRRVGNLDVRTRAMLACARKAGAKFSITQGSWSHAGASAGTHAGGGAVDLVPASYKLAGLLRGCGFAAWARGAKFGSPSFSPHVHAIAVGNKNLSAAAAAQVRSFKAGRNGLAGNGKDNQPQNSCSGKSGDCNSFKPMAAQALQRAGIGSGQLGRFMSLMKKESGCRPGVCNNWDSNARAGMASCGLMQVIPPTFRANHCPGTSNNIKDPFANMCAAARYIKRRYGGRVPGSPYRSGTLSAMAGWHMVGENGPEMVRLNGGQKVRTHARSQNMLDRAMSGGKVEASVGGGNTYEIHIHGPVYAKSSQDFENMLAGALQNLKRKRRLPR